MLAELVGVGWQELAAEWSALFARDEDATPFSSVSWALAWWTYWAGGADPWVITVRDGGQLVAVAPLFRRRRGPARTLAGLGTIVGNYWDVIAAPEHREPATRAVLDLLDRRGGDWDALVLDRLAPGSPTVAALGQAGLRVRHRPPTPSPRIELPESFDAYMAARSKNRRKLIRRYLRPLDNGELALVEVRDPAGIAAAIKAWQRLRVSSWRERGKAMNPEHGSERFAGFLTDALGALVPEGLAEVWELRRDGAVVAVGFELVDERTHYHWLVSFDAGHGELRPGHVLAAAHIRSAIAAGRRHFDFMVGDEPYKQHWGAVERQLPWLVVTNGRVRSRAAGAAAHGADRVRALRG